MSQTLTVAFPAHVLRRGYLSQGKGSLSGKLQSLFLPYSIRNTRENLELHIVSHRRGLPRPTSTPTPLGEGLQDQLPPTPMRGYMSAHFLGVSGSFPKIGRKACFHRALSRRMMHCAGWWLCPHHRCRFDGARECLKIRRRKGTCLFSFLLFCLVSCVLTVVNTHHKPST